MEEKIKVYEDKNEVNNAAILCEKGFTNPLFVNYTELFRMRENGFVALKIFLFNEDISVYMSSLFWFLFNITQEYKNTSGKLIFIICIQI